jgi:hypothetical protein
VLWFRCFICIPRYQLPVQKRFAQSKTIRHQTYTPYSLPITLLSCIQSIALHVFVAHALLIKIFTVFLSRYRCLVLVLLQGMSTARTQTYLPFELLRVTLANSCSCKRTSHFESGINPSLNLRFITKLLKSSFSLSNSSARFLA